MRLVWENMGKPKHKYNTLEVNGYCACCGVPIEGGFASVRDVVGTAFGRNTDFMTFGTHVCNCCAWLCAFPKETHRNVLAAGSEVWWPMISHDSATEERPSWFNVLKEISAMPKETPVIGVMTTDPKPRLWPMTQEMTVGNFGLYVHCPDYDVSTFLTLSIETILEYSKFLNDLLNMGFSKKACFYGTLGDKKRAKKDVLRLLRIESTLKEMRCSDGFVVSLLVSGKLPSSNKKEITK